MTEDNISRSKLMLQHMLDLLGYLETCSDRAEAIELRGKMREVAQYINSQLQAEKRWKPTSSAGETGSD